MLADNLTQLMAHKEDMFKKVKVVKVKSKK
jgi:hypothetical protein